MSIVHTLTNTHILNQLFQHFQCYPFREFSTWSILCTQSYSHFKTFPTLGLVLVGIYRVSLVTFAPRHVSEWVCGIAVKISAYKRIEVGHLDLPFHFSRPSSIYLRPRSSKLNNCAKESQPFMFIRYSCVLYIVFCFSGLPPQRWQLESISTTCFHKCTHTLTLIKTQFPP